MQEFVTHSREETVAVGREFAKTLPAGALIAFTGGLGAGKTAFCQGLAEGLGCTDPVSSPTFAIVNYYRGPRPLAHFDLYRISTENDLCAAGFYDYLDQGAIVAAEWSENFADLLALEQPIHVNIERVDENTRKITIGEPDTQGVYHVADIIQDAKWMVYEEETFDTGRVHRRAGVMQVTGNEPDQQERGSVTGRALTVEWMKDPLYVDAEHPNTRWIESWYDPKA